MEWDEDELARRLDAQIDAISDIQAKADLLEDFGLAYEEVQGQGAAALKKKFSEVVENFHRHLVPLAETIKAEVEKFHVVLVKSDGKSAVKIQDPEEAQEFFDHVRFSEAANVPEEIRQFDVNQEHTLNTQEYVDNRVSRSIGKMMNKVNETGRNTEVFIGTEREMNSYYTLAGMKRIAEMRTNSSNRYFLYQDVRDPAIFKVIVFGVGSQARLTNALLSIKCLGVDLNKVALRGLLEPVTQSNLQRLRTAIQKMPDKIDMVFMGKRAEILVQLAKECYPYKMIGLSREEEIKTANKLLKVTEVAIDSDYKMSYCVVEIEGKKKTIVTFRMPNGHLASYATQALLERGVSHFIMVGAGGSLNHTSRKNSLQLITESHYGDRSVKVDQKRLTPLQLPSHVPVMAGRNVTLDSPLLETEAWRREMVRRGMDSADIESNHILRILENIGDDVQLTLYPVLFMSDEIGNVPLNKKIGDDSFEHLPTLAQSCFDVLWPSKFSSSSSASSSAAPHHRSLSSLSQYEASPHPSAHRLSLSSPVSSHQERAWSASLALGRPMVEGASVEERIQASSSAMKSRRDFVRTLFQTEIREAIQKILNDSKTGKSFDEAVSICGFNRLWTRDAAAASTDVDYLIVVDCKDESVRKKIQSYMEKIIKTRLLAKGIETEAKNHLIVKASSYFEGLNDPRSALFTLANCKAHNMMLIDGSQELFKRMFYLTDEQLAYHFEQLLALHDKIPKTDLGVCRKQLLSNLERLGDPYREQLLNHLHRMANSELYISETPYKGKQTIQTFYRDLQRRKPEEGPPPISIKACFNRIVDLFTSTTLMQKAERFPIPEGELARLEQLGIILGNIVSKIALKGKNPLFKITPDAGKLTLEHLQQTSPSDRRVIAQLLKDHDLDPEDPAFPEQCYRALMQLSYRMLRLAQRVESAIYEDAAQFAAKSAGV